MALLIQGLSPNAPKKQSEGVKETVKLIAPPAAETDALDGLRPFTRHAVPACVTLTVWPATVKLPTRWNELVLDWKV